MAIDLGDYIDVATRITEFRAKYPDGFLAPLDRTVPYRIEQVGDRTFVVVVAAAHRTPDDTSPGVGMAWEPFPGQTPYTKNSELMNAETSAWDRATIALGAADANRGIASREEVEAAVWRALTLGPRWSKAVESILSAADAYADAVAAERIAGRKRLAEAANEIAERKPQ